MWKKWPHGSSLTTLPSSNPSKQTAHPFRTLACGGHQNGSRLAHYLAETFPPPPVSPTIQLAITRDGRGTSELFVSRASFPAIRKHYLESDVHTLGIKPLAGRWVDKEPCPATPLPDYLM
jgi:hypothetical protein